MEQWAPLNLVKSETAKSRPVAVVAPSSVRQDEEKELQRPTEGTKSNNSANYQIDRLLGKPETDQGETKEDDEDDEEEEEQKPEWPSLTEQQILAAVYMRDFVNTYNSLFPNVLPNPGISSYDSAVYESYRRLLLNGAPEKKPDPYPNLRERLNAVPDVKPDYERTTLPTPSPEPLNLRISKPDDLPLDFSKKRNFLLSPNQTLSLKSPEFESVTKPLVLTIPNPQERAIQPKRRERSAKSRRSSSLDKNSSSSHHTSQDSKNQDSGGQNDKKKPHIKKPLNAFMLYMKEMRAKVVAECTLKESAAINQILGRRWHALGREEQAKYYEMARRERQLHMQLYPDWSSRANSSRGKKRKRKQEANDGGNNLKKCRARYGLDQQSQWCKPCRRKKKCIRYMESGEERDGNQSEDNMEDCGSVGDANTPPDDDDCGESLAHSLSSPGGLSGLSSLTSPSMILPSPSTSLASPSVSLASPCMSLQSPLTPPTFDMKPILPIPLPPLHRPVGTNPHDVNNPLSVNQLTGKCIKSEPKERSRAISVT